MIFYSIIILSYQHDCIPYCYYYFVYYYVLILIYIFVSLLSIINIITYHFSIIYTLTYFVIVAISMGGSFLLVFLSTIIIFIYTIIYGYISYHEEYPILKAVLNSRIL